MLRRKGKANQRCFLNKARKKISLLLARKRPTMPKGITGKHELFNKSACVNLLLSRLKCGRISLLGKLERIKKEDKSR